MNDGFKRQIIYPSFLRRRMLVRTTPSPSTWNFGSNWPRNRQFSADIRS